MTILITTPDHDDSCAYMRAWSQEIVELAKEKYPETIRLDKKSVTRREFEGRIEALNPKLVILNGHGSEEEVSGQGREEIILKFNENDELMKGRIVYARACGSAAKLGKSCVEKGAVAYVGYKNDFYLLWDKNMITRPLHDEIAGPFMEVSNVIPKAIIKGNSIREALERTEEKLKDRIEYLETKRSFDAQFIVPLLILNAINQQIHGNLDAAL